MSNGGFSRGLTGLVLRVILGAIFLWAAVPKLFYDMPVQGETAAVLANLGLLEPGAANADPDAGDGAGGESGDAAADTAMLSAGYSVVRVQETPNGDEAPEPTAEPRPKAEPQPEPAEDGEPMPEDGDAAGEADSAEAAPRYTAADFPEPVMVKRYYGLVLLMHGASKDPEPGKVRLVPEAIGQSGLALRLLGLGAAVTELVGGGLIVIGLLSRLWALGFIGTMLVAAWLTQIGPAIGDPNAFLGFLPDLKYDEATWSSEGANTFLFQAATFGCAFAVLFLGPGAVSVDRLLFGGRGDGDDDD